MEIFISRYTSRLDDKNRLSVPAVFRDVINLEGEMVVYGYCSFTNGAIEVCTKKRIMEIQKYIEEMEIFSPQRDALETSILGDLEVLNIDGKGRIILSERMIKFANINKEAAFVGKGRIFEIWALERFSAYHEQARNYAISNKITLKQTKKVD